MKMEKRKFRIGELAHNLNVKQFVIRFWEKEFNIKPSRSDGGQRFYSQEDFDRFTLIKELLYNKRFTLEGAKSELTNLSTKKNDMIIPSSRTTLSSDEESSLENQILLLRTQLIKLKNLL